MAEILSSFVKPAMEELGRITVVKIKHLFTYLCFFNNNIRSLRNGAQELEDARVGLQRQVEAAENDAQVILPEVRTWLENASTKIQVDKKRIDNEIPAVENSCFCVKSRFQLSREAVKITGEMKELMEKRKQITDIATPAPPVAQAEIPLGITHEFDSRKQIEEDIVNALKAKEVTTMGICGMGGVGKTTMAKRIMVRVKKENIFEEVFMAVISQQADLLRIQDEIAEQLGLTLGEKTLQARANKIRTRLMSTKRILIVIDDVWEKLKLEDLGIPCGNEKCTILLTSRNKDVLKEMDAKVYGVEILSDTEAWFLFREKTGPCVNDPNLLSTAEKVARECKGLPIALITVGGALKDQTNITFWEDALQQLKSFNPEDMPSVIKDVYNPLKLSYTKLESRRAKSLFLLCSLFPEDANISLEELTSYCIGLQMFSNLDFSNASEGILEIVRKRVFTIVDMLKNHFLLLNGRDEHHVKMHDVVRDVAIYIASHEAKEGMIVDVKFNSMNLSSEYTYHSGSVFAEKTSSFLRMHRLDGYINIEIKDFYIFEGIKQLSLLSFQSITMKSIPLEIQLLKNLQTLRLVGCKLESFSMVGKLSSLKILDCQDCDGIKELPGEIGNLKQLRQLNFSGCRSLYRIPPGVISNLVDLEEFKMLASFCWWELAAAEVQGQERRNACLNEFANLSKLTCLEIQVKDFNLAAEEISFSPNIVRYHIRIGADTYFSYHHDTSHAKRMVMKLHGHISLGSWVVRFLDSANQLDFKGVGSRPLDLRQAHIMKSLTFINCSTVRKLVNSTTSIHDQGKYDVFPILEKLWLYNLHNLEEIYDGTILDQSNLFRNLERLSLGDLPALKHLVKRSNRSIVSLDNLREIRIVHCNNLHSLFSFTNYIGTDQISTARNVDELLCTQTAFFPLLETLELERLDKLEVIWNSPIPNQGSHSFKNLRTLKLNDLSSMTYLWKSPNLNVSLSSLSQIYIDKCHKLRNIFSSTLSMDFLFQVTKLEIKNCKMMEQVALNENNENQYRTVHFPKLLELTLDSLESLTTFGKGVESIEFHTLEEMNIIHCPKLMSLFFNSSNQNSTDDHEKCTSHLFCGQQASFPMLETLKLESLDELEVIWDSSIPNHGSYSFKNLKTLNLDYLPSMTHLWKSPNLRISLSSLSRIYIDRCRKLRSLFSSTMPMDFLLQLTHLGIRACEMMEQVVLNENDENHPIHFSKLLSLRLDSLKSLTAFGKGVESIEFPMLEQIFIEYCPKLMRLLFSDSSNQNPAHDHDKYAPHLFCSQKISFGSLKRVTIWHNGQSNIWCHQIPAGFFCQLEELQIMYCEGIISLFSSSIVENLANLKKLDICGCKEMVKVIKDDEEMSVCEKPRILFPNLKELEFIDLPKLECFCNWRCDLLQLPSLVEVGIRGCSLLQFFTMKSVTTPKLQKVTIDWVEKVRDLNSAIQRQFEINQRRQLNFPQKESTSTEPSEVE